MKKRKKTLHILIDQVKLRSEEKKYIKKKMKYPIGERIFLVIGWIAVSPFVIRECVIQGFKWVVKKIKKK